jgi:hypothetical protein
MLDDRRLDAPGELLAIDGQRPQDVARLPHGHRGLEVVAGKVTDHQRRRPAGQPERVIPVAADLGRLGGRDVADGDLQRGEFGQLGEHAALQRDRHLGLLRVAKSPGGCPGGPARAPRRARARGRRGARSPRGPRTLGPCRGSPRRTRRAARSTGSARRAFRAPETAETTACCAHRSHSPRGG